MEFTYNAYKNMILLLKEHNYSFVDYKNYDMFCKSVILRHDIDKSLEKALRLAELENELEVTSYYFVLLSTDFYNINSKKSINILKKIQKLGSKIGLHFDETKYNIHTREDYIKYVLYEINLLSQIIGTKVDVVSMHRPSKKFLEMDLEISNIINSYQKKYFNDFKYISDSRRNWREDPISIIKNNKNNRLHILTHAFWYNDTNIPIEETIKKYIFSAILERYDNIDKNMKNLDEIITKESIQKEIVKQ